MNTKLVKTIREAIALAGLKDGMTISFHHHLRNGDYVLNLVMDEIAAMGIRDSGSSGRSCSPRRPAIRGSACPDPRCFR